MRKLTESRILRLALIGLFMLFSIKLISYGLIVWITRLIEEEVTDSMKIDAYISLVRILTVSISGSVATIIAAVAARYGAREAMGNYRNNAGHTGGELK